MPIIEKVGDTHNEAKDISEFNKSADGTHYSNCSACFLNVWRSNQLKFWPKKIPEDVAFVLKLYHCPSTQKMLTEYLTGIVKPAIAKSQHENILKEELLKKRLVAPSPIIDQAVTRTRRLRALRKNNGDNLWI